MRPLYLLAFVAESLFAIAVLAEELVADSLGKSLQRIEDIVYRKSPLERTFENLCDIYHIPEAHRNYRFSPERRFTFDFAWPDQKAAVEIDGGNRMVRWSKAQKRAVVVGKHTKPSDYEKRNLATVLGWRVLYFTGDQLKRNPKGVIDQVKVLLGVDRVKGKE